MSVATRLAHGAARSAAASLVADSIDGAPAPAASALAPAGRAGHRARGAGRSRSDRTRTGQLVGSVRSTEVVERRKWVTFDLDAPAVHGDRPSGSRSGPRRSIGDGRVGGPGRRRSACWEPFRVSVDLDHVHLFDLQTGNASTTGSDERTADSRPVRSSPGARDAMSEWPDSRPVRSSRSGQAWGMVTAVV